MEERWKYKNIDKIMYSKYNNELKQMDKVQGRDL